MKSTMKFTVLCSLGLALGHVHAQYQVNKHAITHGGGQVSGGSYELTGSVGQADANNPVVGGPYALSSGVLQKNTDLIFRNKFD